MSPQELLAAAPSAGLNGVCVTDHYSIAGADVTQRLSHSQEIPVFRGVEARTDLGDMLVFGYYRDLREGISLDRLCAIVHEAGGLVFAAHPFHTRGGPSLAQAFRRRGLDLETEWDRVEAMRHLDGVETLNGNVAPADNALARSLGAQLGVPGIGGSDAHTAHMLGTAATRFPAPIRSDHELVAALRHGDYRPARLGDTGEIG